MDSVIIFFFLFTTYVASAMWFHWRGFNLGLDAARKLYQDKGNPP